MDYLAAHDKCQIYFVDRRGKTRLKPNKQLHFSERNPLYSDFSGGAKVLASDISGNVFAFYLDGKVEQLLRNEMSENHFFVAANLTGDRKPELILADANRLEVYSFQGKLLFKKELNEEIAFMPVIYEFSSNDKKIGLTATKSGEIWLLNNDGTVYEGFPLRGASSFSISSFPELEDKFNLIVNDKDNFLLNYSVK
jgi:hypothetical protein